MKQMRWLGVALFAWALAGCGGGGGANSPTFETQLLGVEVTPPSATVAVGQTVTFSAVGTFTTPEGGTTTRVIPTDSVAQWSSSNTDIAIVGPDGVASGRAQGATTITVTVNSDSGPQTNSASLVVNNPELIDVVIDADASTTVVESGPISVPQNGVRRFRALGIFEDSVTPRELGNRAISWSITPDNVLSANNFNGPTFSVTAVGAPQSSADVRVTATANDGGTVNSSPLTVNVDESTLRGLVRIEQVTPTDPPNTIAVDAFTEYRAVGEFGSSQGGSVEEITLGDELVNWNSSNIAVATINAGGFVEGQSVGTTTITASLKDTAGVNGATSASEGLSVTDAICTSPLSNVNNAAVTVSDERNGLCVLCDTVDILRPQPLPLENIVDANPLNFAEMIVPVGLLGGSLSIIVNAGEVVTPSGVAGDDVGFVIAQPNGRLLDLSLLQNITVSTLLNGAEVESGLGDQGGLRVSLLGVPVLENLLANGGSQEANLSLASFRATQPFNALKITLNSGVLTALERIAVFRACAAADLSR